jgi:hypothetical protein
MTSYKKKCPIWGAPASIDRPDGGWVDFVDSPRAGGKFKLDSALTSELHYLQASQKVALTDWLVKQRRSGTECPVITADLVRSFLGAPKTSVIERMDKAIIWIGNWLHTPSDKLCLGSDFTMTIVDIELKSESDKDAPYFFAAICSEAVDDDEGILRLLNDAGYLRPSEGKTFNARADLFMTPSGWQRHAELAKHDALGSQAFVAMWFSKETDGVWADGFYAGIELAGYKPVRIDQKEHNNKIDDEIIAEIRRSKFVVADFTCGMVSKNENANICDDIAIARGGVYFEAGFAKGLGKEVIWTVREDLLKHVHFDTRQFAHIVWKDAEDLKEKLSKRISATFGDGPLKKSA